MAVIGHTESQLGVKIRGGGRELMIEIRELSVREQRSRQHRKP